MQPAMLCANALVRVSWVEVVLALVGTTRIRHEIDDIHQEGSKEDYTLAIGITGIRTESVHWCRRRCTAKKKYTQLGLRELAVDHAAHR